MRTAGCRARPVRGARCARGIGTGQRSGAADAGGRTVRGAGAHAPPRASARGRCPTAAGGARCRARRSSPARAPRCQRHARRIRRRTRSSRGRQARRQQQDSRRRCAASFVVPPPDLSALASGDAQRVASQTGPVLALLERVRAHLEGDVALGLTFQGSYSQTRPREPAYGGHASAMGPAPAEPPVARRHGPVPVTFEEGARLPSRMYCGGPTKDHILESACGGVALFDYDGDGRLDIYLVTAAELTPARERVAHRNALYRNLGGWKFADVSKRAGVDAAAWGSGVCAGDADGDGRLDLYVTNWGANLLYRNRGDGTFEDVAAARRRGRRRLEHGLHVLRRRRRRRSGSVRRAVCRDHVGLRRTRAKRTLTWRDGPHVMVGPAGLPGESDLVFRERREGKVRRGHRGARPVRSGRAPTGSAWWPLTTTMTASSICSWRTTRTRISSTATSGTAASKARD